MSRNTADADDLVIEKGESSTHHRSLHMNVSALCSVNNHTSRLRFREDVQLIMRDVTYHGKLQPGETANEAVEDMIARASVLHETQAHSAAARAVDRSLPRRTYYESRVLFSLKKHKG